MKKKLLFNFICFISLFFSFSVSSSDSFNPYKILGIEISATEEEIRKAYKREAQKWHPDRKTDPKEKEEAEKRFKEIQEAYSKLKDPRERERFRNYGSQTAEYSSWENAGAQTDSEAYRTRTFKDIFNESQKARSAEQVELKPYEKRAIETFYEFSFFKKQTSEFLEAEARYLGLIKEQQSGQTLSKEQKKELNDYRVENLKDLEVFKRILSQLGLPYEVLHPILLQTYLDDLKREWYHNNKSSKPLLKDLNGHSYPSNSAVRFQERRWNELAESRFVKEEIRRVLEQIKTHFDTIQYESLKQGSAPWKGAFLKNFGAQFIVFHAALGFSIYMQALYDKKITGFEKNPEELMQNVGQILTPSGIFSFFIFVSVAAQAQYRIYGLGRYFDGKKFFGKYWNGRMGRSLAPSFGLGLGFFAYSVFDELWRDPNLRGCVGSFFKKEPQGPDSPESSIQQRGVEEHISSCEQFLINWLVAEKWKILGVDIAAIIGSSILSHKITSSIVRALNRTMLGHSAMAWVIRNIPSKVIRGGNFFINMLLFLEIHKVLESWAGKPLKEQLLAGGVNKNVSGLSDNIEKIDSFIRPEFWSAVERPDPRSRAFFTYTINSIQFLGQRFRLWKEHVNRDYAYSYSLWTQKLDKRFMNYETGLEILDEAFALSQLDYNDSHYSNFQFDILDKDRDHYKKKYCHFVGEELDLWKDFCVKNSEVPSRHKKFMIYETSHLLFDFLRKIQFPEYDFRVEDYISLKTNEIFSSNPEFSVQKFMKDDRIEDYDKKIYLAKQMIKKGLELKTVLEGFSEYEISELTKEKAERMDQYLYRDIDEDNKKKLFNYFMNPRSYSSEIKDYCEFLTYNLDYEKDLEDCLIFFETSGEEDIKEDISLKFLIAGNYLLQDFLKKEGRHLLYTHSSNRIIKSQAVFEDMEDLLWLIEPYRKGERAFVKYIETIESAKGWFSKTRDQIPGINRLFGKNGNPYFVFYGLICRSFVEKDSDSFSAPQLLKDFDKIELYNFTAKQYEALSSVCKDKAPYSEEVIHDFLFERPAKHRGVFYENLYLSIEHIIGSSYANKEGLMTDYYELSLDQLELLSGETLSEIQLLTDQFYRKTINFDLEIDYSLDPYFFNQELLNYYDENKVYFNVCSFSSELSFNLSQSLLGDCEEGFKNIEVSIFQVNHLLKNLKTLLIKGDKIQVCEGGECESLNQRFLNIQKLDEEGFDLMRSNVISWLQNIQDCYKENKEDCLTEGQLKKEQLNEGLMLHILENSIPELRGNFSMKNLDRTESHWEKLAFSLLFEINQSLNNFKDQILPLTLKKGLEKRLEEPGISQLN